MQQYAALPGDAQITYDSTKYFVEHCPNSRWASWAFDEISASAQSLSRKDTGIWIELREWLKSVMFLNLSDQDYFCNCLATIGATYNSKSDTSKTLYWKDQNRSLAIGLWELRNLHCSDSTRYYTGYNATRHSQREDWLIDTTVEYDTTLPTMQELGLDTLLAKYLLLQNQKSVKRSPDILTTATASPNPTGNGTVLTFGMAQAAYVRVELFDVLGSVVRGPSSAVRGFEEYLGVGNHSVPLDMSTLASGPYYARLTTAYGETRTVKIVKQ